MVLPTNISIHTIRMTSADRLAKISVSSTMQIGNHVRNHRVEGFGEHSGDRGAFQFPEFVIDDSDMEDSNSEKT
ncbi:hypothetical protein [Lederbergia citrea]|uniref:Uncharacterized protein n=1 Tax=Lederbergia citrea TaxID=2833581 RepID=A0A942Z578_9BACI|nr:hypothetical protein [Lederbergia citrea]MBS4178314.1 hypothetical protein [Lederbergia citrea]MBS4204990.1 hypothetical protein [Lederbergia citrea]MBS4223155.1 hypothetical protein [Lederbergia citrea]